MRKLALLLVLCMLLPTMGVYAEGDSTEEMTAAITAVKERVDIPEDCTEFWGNMNLRGEEKSWDFRWETPGTAKETASVSVHIRESGIIESIYMYRYDEEEYKRGKTLPKISVTEAEKTAVEFAAKVNPAISAEYADRAEAVLYGDQYQVNISRSKNGIPVYNNGASVSLDSQSGAVESYSVRHTDTAVFPAVENTRDVEQAMAAYRKNGYIEKEYRIFDGKACLVYTPGQSADLIDATAGKPYVPVSTGENFRNELPKLESSADAAAGLTPQEQKAVEEVAGLIKYEEAAKIIKENPYFYVPEDTALTVGNTYKLSDGQYVLRITLQSRREDSYASIYAELDGKTGEVLSFSASDKLNSDAKADKDKAEKTYDAFVAEYLKAYHASLGEKRPDVAEKAVHFRTERTENGIPVYGDGIYVTMEPGGKITNYQLNWTKNVTFPSPEDSISEDKAYEILFADAAPTLSYYAEKEKGVLVYAMEYRDYSFISALDGEKLFGSGRHYVPTKNEPYTDIAGHFAETAIQALSSIGARLGGTEFKPDTVITQAEFVMLVLNCVMNYQPLLDGTLDTTRLYSYAINQRILPKDEEAPDTPLTREMAVAYLLRAMGYREFAEIEGIFRCDFADADRISPSLYGYVAIAKGLGIVNGDGSGKFAPSREMTRGEAAVVIYNYLK